MNPQPYILQHVLCIGAAAHRAREKPVELWAKRLDQDRRGFGVGLLILSHQLLDVRTRRRAGRLPRLHFTVPSIGISLRRSKWSRLAWCFHGHNLGSVSNERKGVVSHLTGKRQRHAARTILPLIVLIPLAHAQ